MSPPQVIRFLPPTWETGLLDAWTPGRLAEAWLAQGHDRHVGNEATEQAWLLLFTFPISSNECELRRVTARGWEEWGREGLQEGGRVMGSKTQADCSVSWYSTNIFLSSCTMHIMKILFHVCFLV